MTNEQQNELIGMIYQYGSLREQQGGSKDSPFSIRYSLEDEISKVYSKILGCVQGLTQENKIARKK